MMRNWIRLFSAGVIALAFLLGGAGVARADTYEVTVQNNFFDMNEITIAPGDTVRWVFTQGLHTTTSVDALWDSGVLAAGSTYEYTFSDVGDYYYFCTRHIDCCNMAGVVHVVSGCCPPK
jgi:plastocyanin